MAASPWAADFSSEFGPITGLAGTFNTFTTVATGRGNVVSHSPTQMPFGGYSFHDCTTPDVAGPHNCIWPVGAAPGVPVPFKQGLVLMPRLVGQSGQIQVVIQ